MTRTLDVRVDILRNNVKIGELIPIGAPTIRMDASSNIKTSFSGDFIDNDVINWLNDEIQPIVIIDGVEHKLGIFSPATVTQNNTDEGRSISVDAYDRCWNVDAMKTENVLYLASGTNYITAINSLLLACGITLINSTPTNLTLRTAREDWNIGTSYLEIINQLLDEINYNPLWFDKDGMAVLEPNSVMNVTESVRTYDYQQMTSLMLINVSAVFDLFNAPNVFVCVCSNPDGNARLIARAENTNAASPLSINRRGKRIVKVIKVDNIASQDALNDYAQIQCTEQMFTGNTIEISTAIIPDCGVNDVVALVYPNLDGLCIEESYEIELCTGGEMRHTLKQHPIADIPIQPVIPSYTGAIAGLAVAGLAIVETQ